MSNFDLKLDRWEKIVSIAVGLVGAGLGAYFVHNYQIPEQEDRKWNDCTALLKSEAKKQDSLDEIIKQVNRDKYERECPKHKKATENIIAARESLLAEIEQKESFRAKFLIAKAEIAALKGSTQQIDVREPRDGFVSLGRKKSPHTSNFIETRNDEKAVDVINNLKIGSILKARWSVNLRKSKDNTASGKNRSIAIIYEGDCVRLDEKPNAPLRGSWWVEVSLVDCPTK